MLSTRHLLAEASLTDLTRSPRDSGIERRIIPERTDGLIPRFDLLLAGHACGLKRHPVGNWQDSSTSATGEVAADDMRQRSAIANKGWDAVDHRFRGDSAEGLLPYRRH